MDTRVAVEFGAGIVAVAGMTVIAQMVAIAAVRVGVLAAALDEQYALAALGEDAGGDAARAPARPR